MLDNARPLPEPVAGPAPVRGSDAVTVIGPSAGGGILAAAELWRYRELLGFLIWRDIKVRYQQTALGAAWAVLQPTMMMVVFTIFFSRMAHVRDGGLAYPLLAYAGLLPWSFFATAVANAGNSVIASERLVTKVYFPRLTIPFAAVGAAAVDFAIACPLLAGLMWYYGAAPGPNLWLALPVFAAVCLTATGIGTLIAALNVAYRDFRYVVPFMLQVWMLVTPTVYMEPEAGSAFRAYQVLNPMASLVESFRAAVLGRPVAGAELAAAAAAGLALFAGGCWLFRRMEDRFADII